MENFKISDRQQYLNLETFRKSGIGVKTPVWFVQDNDTIFVRTIHDSGKVKRIRNNGRVNIAPCKMDGALLADWAPAIAHIVQNEATERKVDHLLDQKYGLLKKIFAAVTTLRGSKYTVLEIKEGK